MIPNWKGMDVKGCHGSLLSAHSKTQVFFCPRSRKPSVTTLWVIYLTKNLWQYLLFPRNQDLTAHANCLHRNAPCQQDLVIDKVKPPVSAEKWQHNDQTDLQCQAARHCHHQVQRAIVQLSIEDLDLVLKERRLRWYGHVEHSNGAVKTAFDTGWWKAWAWKAQDDMEAADREGLQSGSSRLLTVMIDKPGDLVRDLPCVQQASFLEGGPLMWMLPLYLHIYQKSDHDMIFS